ncbi:MAG: hypothetical protein PWQ09_632 [Candidatus Cloacimonadota bacterium]|jgi:hypothetical protein|nr:hypothetical protein [Candidatus Cloacimonadota bacterium]
MKSHIYFPIFHQIKFFFVNKFILTKAKTLVMNQGFEQKSQFDTISKVSFSEYKNVMAN